MGSGTVEAKGAGIDYIVTWPRNELPFLAGRERALVIRASERLAEFERWYASTVLASRSYDDALETFAALWRHARQLNASFPGPWEEDIAADIELARVLNGLPRGR